MSGSVQFESIYDVLYSKVCRSVSQHVASPAGIVPFSTCSVITPSYNSLNIVNRKFSFHF